MMYEEIIIRNPRVNDAYHIFKIHRESLEGLDEEDYTWFLNLLKIKSRRRIILVASNNNGDVLGFIIAYKYRQKVYIDALAVHPDHRGKGIGGKLLSALEEKVCGKTPRHIYLSVKKDNYKALGFYLRQGYRVDGLVLELTAVTEKITAKKRDDYAYKILPASEKPVWRKKILPTTWWSTLTEPVDKMIYTRIPYEEMIIITKKEKVRGIAEFEPAREITIDYLAVSYHRPREALEVLVSTLKTYAIEHGVARITIPVDASKSAIISTLLSMGFRINGSEYRLKKVLPPKKV